MDLEQYIVLRKQKDFKTLMQVLQTIYLKYTDPSLLDEVATTLGHLSRSDHKLQDEAEQGVREIASDVAKRFKELTADGVDDNEEVVENLLVVLTRMECISRHRFVNTLKWNASMGGVLQSLLLGGGSDAVIQLLLEIFFINILWARTNLDQEKPAKSALKEIVSNNATFCSHIQHVLSNDFPITLKEKVYLLATDLFVMFSPGQFIDTPLEELSLSLPEEVTTLYADQFAQMVNAGNNLGLASQPSTTIWYTSSRETLAKHVLDLTLPLPLFFPRCSSHRREGYRSRHHRRLPRGSM